MKPLQIILSIIVYLAILLTSCSDDTNNEPAPGNSSNNSTNDSTSHLFGSGREDTLITEVHWKKTSRIDTTIGTSIFPEAHIYGDTLKLINSDSRFGYTLFLYFHKKIKPGKYSLNDTSFYSAGFWENKAKSAELEIVTHYIPGKIWKDHFIEGRFNFETDTASIKKGRFSLEYLP